ncbi:MAG: hypothetical protein QGF21_08865 [Vicinamibacterales bacterium]|jgi:hypothetical protein|nr:hypothetical protein [Vicinamibacterales bacterium]MDP7672042.1 hypothetical protein [Vicinamibacterales bacterium]HJO39203.1 hypothetical protein [Vicinamibacterales bacterium]|tara:strand:+ start:2598 stop:3602 length:1005 start_codon:yes stop_codon:yes gene_type:complete
MTTTLDMPMSCGVACRALLPSALVALVMLPGAAAAQPEQSAADPVVHLAVVDHEPASEISGIVKSQTYPDVYWVHNDSGDDPRIFAIDGSGRIVMPRGAESRFHVGPESTAEGRPLWPGLQILAAAHFDWEDIALADGRLYIAETGNNGNARRDLGVYVVNEPNPRAVRAARIITFLPIRYPDQDLFPARQWHFDSEALFVSAGKLHFVTKHRPVDETGPEPGAKLYRLDTEHTDRENVLMLVGARDDLVWPTAASVSPDGRRLAVLTLEALWLFDQPSTGGDWFAGEPQRIPLPQARTRQAEAVCWDDARTLRIATEQRDLFIVDLEAVTAER